MSIYHCSAKVIKRSDGRSAVGAAAYRSGQAITDERTGIVHDYSKKKGVDFTAILTPDHAAQMTRSELWNLVEKIENRKDAQVAREIEVAIPKELNFEQMREVVTQYAQSQFVDKGMFADVAIHHAKGDNPHAHILLTTREIKADGFGKKNRDWNQKEILQEWREQWEKHANHALKKAGHEARIDHRTLEAQGIDQIPQIHIGPNVVKMEQRGIRTERGGRTLEIEQTNAQIIDLQTYRKVIEHERNIEITAGAERGGIGDRDRTTGSSTRRTGGRHTTNPDRATGGQQTSGGGVEPNPKPERQRMAAGGQGHAGSRADTDRGIAEREPSRARLDMATVGGGLGDAYSGAADRIVALAGAANICTRGRGLDDPQNHLRDNRTEQQITRQLKAMGDMDDIYDIGIRDPKGRMINRLWTPNEVIQNSGWLKRMNARGNDIYVKQEGDEFRRLMLVDALNQDKLDQMKTTGLAPAVVVETSIGNYQAWVVMGVGKLNNKVATATSKEIAAHLETDPKNVNWCHFGRLAGFANRTPDHSTKTGHNPWVLCHESSGQMASQGLSMVVTATQRVRREKAAQEARKQAEWERGREEFHLDLRKKAAQFKLREAQEQAERDHLLKRVERYDAERKAQEQAAREKADQERRRVELEKAAQKARDREIEREDEEKRRRWAREQAELNRDDDDFDIGF